MLYSIKKPFAIHHIQQNNHTLYFEEYGNLDGIPAIFLHGGPGSGCNDSQKAIFDYKKYRVVFLDQRGSGKSSPKGSTRNNTTSKLIEDIEVVRKYLKIESWVVVGGSWGATLALAYAQVHTSKVESIILRALFLGTKKPFLRFCIESLKPGILDPTTGNPQAAASIEALPKPSL